jgi:hypothetical protein
LADFAEARSFVETWIKLIQGKTLLRWKEIVTSPESD